MKLPRASKKIVAVMLAGAGCAIVGALYLVTPTNTIYGTYIHISPGIVGPTMYMTGHPILANTIPIHDGEIRVALKYLRSHYDPHYWSFSMADPLPGTAGVVTRQFPYGDGPQGTAVGFGLNITPSSTPKAVIVLERLFRNGTRWIIQTSGNPFTGIANAYSPTWPQSSGMVPDIPQVYNYLPNGQTFVNDFYVVEHIQNGPYHSVILHDAYAEQTDYLIGAVPNYGWPYDPDTGYGNYRPLVVASGPPPPENDTPQTSDPIISAPCTNGLWYPEGTPIAGQTVPNLPCYADPLVVAGSG